MTISQSFPTPKPRPFSEKEFLGSSEPGALNSMLYQHDVRQVSLVTPDYPQKEPIYPSSSPSDDDAYTKEASLDATNKALKISRSTTLPGREQATLAPRPGKKENREASSLVTSCSLIVQSLFLNHSFFLLSLTKLNRDSEDLEHLPPSP